MDCIIIGIDGLDPDLVREWESDLPTLAGLIERGSFGELRSSDPPLSSPAWPTLYTGKQGGKHGVFGFTKEKEESHERVPVNYTDVTAESLWEVLDDAGISVGTVNVPLTYPPSDLDHGYVIAGWPVPNRVEVGNPPSVVANLEDELGESYEVHPFPMQPELKRQSPSERRELLAEGLWHHERAFETLLDLRPVDVFFCVFMAIDHASHHLAWDREELRRMYVEQDNALGELLADVPEQTNVVVVSDHGHGAQGDRNFHTNDWLARGGYLSKLERDVDRSELLRQVGITRENAVRVKNALGIKDVRSLLPQWLFNQLKTVIPPADEREAGFNPSQINWSETTAFSGMQNVIYLTEEIPENQRSRIRKELVDRLEEIPHPSDDRDEPLLTEAHTKDELFEGPHFEAAPDIVFVADEMRCKANVGFAGSVFTDQRWGEHRQYGLLCTAGPAFDDQEDVPERDIKDIFPMLCAHLNVAVPEGIDGTLPTERFVNDISLDRRAESATAVGGENYSEDETSAVRDQLEDLGYLE